MTQTQAQTIINALQAGKQYFRNLDPSREGVSFQHYSAEDGRFVIRKGFYHFDYEEEQFLASHSISEEALLEELIEQEAYVVRDWETRKA